MRAAGVGAMIPLFILAACAGSPPRGVILVTLDTTRADAIRYAVTPNLSSLEADSTVYTHCVTTAPITLPAHASILTGCYPNRHGVRDNSIYRLPGRMLTLAEIFHGEGYHTAAFVSSFILDHRFGLDQGFLRYNDRFLRPKKRWSRLPVDRRAEETIGLALQHLDTIVDTPFFLWIHLYDPHADYDPPPPFDELAPTEPYLGEVAYMDHQLGRLIDHLRRSRLWWRCMTVFVGDHGESLGDHGEPTHGFLLHPSTLDVPLIVHYPGQTTGSRIDRPVSIVDIFPTILDVCGVRLPSGIDGEDLRRGRPRPIFSETFIPESFHWAPLYRVEDRSMAYISEPHGRTYDLREDPGQDRPVASVPARLASALAAYRQVRPTGDRVSLDEEAIRRLKALGYFLAGGSPPAESPPGRPDPFGRMETFRLYITAMRAMESGRLDQAAGTVREILTTEGENPRFLLLAADIAAAQGRTREALEYAERAAQADPADPRNHFFAGFYLQSLGMRRAAEEKYRAALAVRPAHTLSRYNLSRLLILNGRNEEARSILLGLVEDAPNMAGAWNNLGYLAMSMDHDCRRAVEYVEKARALAPDDPTYVISLASTLCACGDGQRATRLLQSIDPKKISPEQRKLLRGESSRCR